MSPVQERAERLQRARNLRPAPKREQMFPVNRPAVRRLSAAQERAEKPERARNLRPAPEQRKRVFPGNRPPVARPARSSRGKG